jgi:hypothetical protein
MALTPPSPACLSSFTALTPPSPACSCSCIWAFSCLSTCNQRHHQMSLYGCADTCNCASSNPNVVWTECGMHYAPKSELAKQTPAEATQSHLSGLSCQGDHALHVCMQAPPLGLCTSTGYADANKSRRLTLSCALRSVSRSPAASSCCLSSGSLACIPEGSLLLLKKQQVCSEGCKHCTSGFADEMMMSECRLCCIVSAVDVQPNGM